MTSEIRKYVIFCMQISPTKMNRDKPPAGTPSSWHLEDYVCHATSWKVTGSIPDFIGIFHWHNPSGRTMALGSTHPLTEMSIRNISWGRPVRRANNLTTFMCRLSWNLGAWNSWKTSGPVHACNGIAFTHSSWKIYMNAVCKARITDYFQDSMITLLTDWLQTIFRQKSSGVLVWS